jgi:NAD-dependent deacetylase
LDDYAVGIEITPSDRVFVLTGAGISAESGIPTYRDAGGLWRNYRFEEVASPEAWRRDPQLVWEYYSMRRRTTASARANPGHVALAQLEVALGDRLFLCTQNVDRLHEDLEEPANKYDFSKCYLGKAGDLLPDFFRVA